MKYQERLNRAIPGGAQTYSRGSDQFPSNAPAILERGQGAYVWDPNGNRYLDYGMSLRAVTLGYANPRVNAAAKKEIDRGNNLTRPSLTELRAAELIIDLIPSVDMVKFSKNGSNATTAAVKIARAFTGRRYVCVPRQHPFFSFDDWFIGTTPLRRGIPADHAASTLVFEYNDLSSLQRLFVTHPREIAAVILEPATTTVPCPPECSAPLTADARCACCPNRARNFLYQVQQLCRKEGALFVLDEMITGFRWALEGAQSYFGVQPDISTFGKGMANGFSVAAVTGRREIMEVGAIDKPGAERTFLLSTTHGGEMSSLGAFIETVAIYRDENVCRHLWNYGKKLRDGITEIAIECGVTKYFMMDGPAISLNFVTRDPSGAISMKYRTLFMQEIARRGILLPWISVSLAHGEAELDKTLSATREALKIYARALDDGVDKYLEGPEIKPVFRKYN